MLQPMTSSSVSDFASEQTGSNEKTVERVLQQIAQEMNLMNQRIETLVRHQAQILERLDREGERRHDCLSPGDLARLRQRVNG